MRDLALTLRSRAIARRRTSPDQPLLVGEKLWQQRTLYDPIAHAAPPGDWIVKVDSTGVRKSSLAGADVRTLISLSYKIEEALTDGNESFVGRYLLYFVEYAPPLGVPPYNDRPDYWALARTALEKITGVVVSEPSHLSDLTHALVGKQVRVGTRITSKGFMLITIPQRLR